MPQTKRTYWYFNVIRDRKLYYRNDENRLVEEEYRELVKEDIQEFISGTVLENSPIIEVDSISKKRTWYIISYNW